MPITALIAQPPAGILRTWIHHHFPLLLIKIHIARWINIAEAFVREAGFFRCFVSVGASWVTGRAPGSQAYTLYPRGSIPTGSSAGPFSGHFKKGHPQASHCAKCRDGGERGMLGWRRVRNAGTEEAPAWLEEACGSQGRHTQGPPWNAGQCGLPRTRHNGNGAQRTRQLALIPNK